MAWGIFMLIVLLGATRGLRNGMMEDYGDALSTTISITPRWTSIPWQGYRTGRRILFYERDLEALHKAFPEITHISPLVFRFAAISAGTASGSWSVYGVGSDMGQIQQTDIRSGRFINALDERIRRKVIVLHPEIGSILFGDEDPIGRQVTVDGVVFSVVGIHKPKNDYGLFSYIPVSTARLLYAREGGFNQIFFSVPGRGGLAENDKFNEDVRHTLAELHGFDPADTSACYISNSTETAIQMRRAFGFLDTLVIIIAIACMIAGIIGVGNIMIVTVRERTHEIGIRKALGAKPWSVLKMIMGESLFITLVSGYVGILAGVVTTEIASRMLSSVDVQGITVFKNPTVDMSIIVGATLFLGLCGIVAGTIPAVRAVRIRPIQAINAK
jgi:putative ABC transport system permease protein